MKITNKIYKQRAQMPLILLIILIGSNVILWGTAFLFSAHNLLMLSTALLAWVFGARHALDADHIAAIDTITRQLVDKGKRPCWIGFYFSSGHSTIVILATTLLIALPSSWLFHWLHLRGSLIGETISGTFLVIMGAITARSACHYYHGLKTQTPFQKTTLPYFKKTYSWKGWQVFLLGLLFGLGFDTASEIGLLSLTSAQHSAEQSFLPCLLLPLLFTGGMTLIDSLDNLVMVRAWSGDNIPSSQNFPSKGRAYYRLGITCFSSFIAFFIGSMELVSLLGVEGQSISSFLVWCETHTELLGSMIIALFLVLWAGYLCYSKRRFFKDRHVRG